MGESRRMNLTLNLSLVTVVCCTLCAAAFPRVARQSFFRCSGWGAGCTNMDYGSVASEGAADVSTGSKADDDTKNSYNMPYLFTSGKSWRVIGKRWGPSSWHSDPYRHRILLPYMLNANNNVWVRHYFPDEYMVFKQQFGQKGNQGNVKYRKQRREVDPVMDDK